LDFDGYSIGGLSVGEDKDITFEMAAVVTKLLPDNKPRYLMGMGLPHDLVEAVRLGVDMFDCVLPTRMGRNGAALTRYGRINIRNNKYAEDFRPLDESCDCIACKYHTRAYLRHLHKAQEILASVLICYHNLYTYQNLMQDIRRALAEGSFEEFYREYRAKLQTPVEENNG